MIDLEKIIDILKRKDLTFTYDIQSLGWPQVSVGRDILQSKSLTLNGEDFPNIKETQIQVDFNFSPDDESFDGLSIHLTNNDGETDENKYRVLFDYQRYIP